MIKLKQTFLAYCPPFLRPGINRAINSPIAYRLAKGAFWSMLGVVISRGLMLVASMLVARMLGKSVYGEFGVINSTINMVSVFAGFGLGLTATKHVAQYRQTDPDRAGRIIGLSGLVAITTGSLAAVSLYVFAPWLAENTINAPHLAGVLRIGSLSLFIGALNSTQLGVLAGFEAFRTIAFVNLFVGLLSFPIFVGGAYWGGLTGAVWALAINLGINLLLSDLAMRKEARQYNVHVSLSGCRQELSVLWKFSMPAVLAGSMVAPVNWICMTLLVNRPDGYAEMGVFSAANQWFIVMLFIPNLLDKVALPILSEQINRNDTRDAARTMLGIIKLNAILVFPLVIGMSIVSPYVMSLYGDEFRDGWPTLVAVLATVGLLAIQTPIGQVIAASGKMWIGLFMNLGWALVFIVATLFFVDQGSFGLAIARAIAYIVHATWTLGFGIWLIRRGMDIYE